MSCPPCEYASEHGWWGPDHTGTHCRVCHRSWAGKREAHCTVCHAHFSADSVADKHRVGGRCLTSAEMRQLTTEGGKKVFRRTTTPKGEVWRSGEALRLREKPAFIVGAAKGGR